MHYKHVLAFETSCDDTSVAIVRHDGYVVACLSANQDLVHKPFGGVVPEIASRNHTLQILPLLEELFSKTKFSWPQIDAIAVTSRPGLIGSLIVGIVTAKTLALAHDKPFLGVNHLEAHLLAGFLHDDESADSAIRQFADSAKIQTTKPKNLQFEYLALAISGGHTQLYHVKNVAEYEVLGRTVDDAAGEAFDKFAKVLGLGFPGGVRVDQEAKNGRRDAFDLPRTRVKDNELDFSFSGLKSAASRLIESLPENERVSRRADLCASFQEAVVDTLMIKLNLAAVKTNLKNILLTGGVSANSRLREVAAAWATKNNLNLFVPPLRYCTDNAAMVGYAGLQRLNRGEQHDHDLSPSATSWPQDFREASR